MSLSFASEQFSLAFSLAFFTWQETVYGNQADGALSPWESVGNPTMSEVQERAVDDAPPHLWLLFSFFLSPPLPCPPLPFSSLLSTVAVAAQHYEYAKTHRAVPFKWMNYIAYEVYQ